MWIVGNEVIQLFEPVQHNMDLARRRVSVRAQYPEARAGRIDSTSYCALRPFSRDDQTLLAALVGAHRQRICSLAYMTTYMLK